jgi:hypothetical protein
MSERIEKIETCPYCGGPVGVVNFGNERGFSKGKSAKWSFTCVDKCSSSKYSGYSHRLMSMKGTKEFALRTFNRRPILENDKKILLEENDIFRELLSEVSKEFHELSQLDCPEIVEPDQELWDRIKKVLTTLGPSV